MVNLRKVLVHSLFWLLYIISEYAVNLPHLKGEAHVQMIRSILFTLPLLMVPTYIMVYYGIPKLLKRKKLFQFSLLTLVILAGVLYGRVIWLELINYLNSGYTGAMPVSKVLKNVIRDYALISLAVCIYIISDWRNQMQINQKLMEAKAKSDLDLLKRQLHPHFLFNTLNNIYSLSLNKSDKTSDSILKLSNLLEFLVYRSNDKQVELVEEIALVKNYIELEKLRYGANLNVELEFKNIDSTLKTTPLILLPFVENCFKHGGVNSEGIFWIHLKINRFENTLQVFVKNSKPIHKKRKRIGTGVGLKNIKERLNLLYKDNFTLQIEDSLHYFEIKLFLNL